MHENDRSGTNGGTKNKLTPGVLGSGPTKRVQYDFAASPNECTRLDRLGDLRRMELNESLYSMTPVLFIAQGHQSLVDLVMTTESLFSLHLTKKHQITWRALPIWFGDLLGPLLAMSTGKGRSAFARSRSRIGQSWPIAFSSQWTV